MGHKIGPIRTIDENLYGTASAGSRGRPRPENGNHLLAGGSRLEHLDVRRDDEAFLDALGVQCIPDPTTAGHFCRRFHEGDVEGMMETINESRLQVREQ